MAKPQGLGAWMAKVGEKGQIVIPKEAREMFDIKPGDTLLLLGDLKRGLAILPGEMMTELAAQAFQVAKEEYDQNGEEA
ncbi:AbrB/MazE/SpoVT family DNA-binding domain-containing protein [Eubacteriales bacterium OttesenSCG-928-N14]|nr:AbrB/MazE/SpoVT family DNA-binding domain-containing protein [Eubacteriales bacterium OttesenSCG-928-N14]